MYRLLMSSVFALCVVSAPAQAEDEPGPKELAALADQISPALVRVEYTLQYDKGQAPGADERWSAWLAWQHAGSTVSEQNWEQWDRLINEERPAERAGLLLTPTKVLTTDHMLHPRFIKGITVRFGDQSVSATPSAYSQAENMVILDLSGPLHDARPLEFAASTAGPYYAVSYGLVDGAWRVALNSVGSSVSVSTDGRRCINVPHNAVIIDAQGQGVGVTSTGRLPLDDSWKVSPLNWPKFDAGERTNLLQSLHEQTDQSLLRVALRLRSPRTAAANPYEGYSPYMNMGDGETNLTEWNGTGVLIDDDLVLVLANFKPKVTARLERIRVARPGGEEVNGQFAGTLTDYGGFLAKLDAKMPGKVRLAGGSISDARDQLLLAAEISVQGENRTAYFNHERIMFFVTGWQRNLYPAVAATGAGGSAYGYGGGTTDASLKFLFNTRGELVGLPIPRRQKVTVQSEWGEDGPTMTAVQQIAPVLATSGAHLDPDNRPLTEDEENRLAWLGVELQPMDPELARANDVSDQTQNGETGAMVTYVYPNSPASAAGLEMGDILLRLHVEGQPKPLDVSLESGMFGSEGFPWQYLDQMPEEYFDQMPQPWGSAENRLTRALTDVGFGKKFTADIVRNGELISTPFTVEEGPPHFDSARRFKSEDLGVTVRDLTYEVRRFFQIKEGEPGVIISKIEKGGKASIAGLKPFEIVLNVNDVSVTTAADFEEAVANPGELKLSVKRMTEGRIVKVKGSGATPASDDEQPAAVEPPADVPDEEPEMEGATGRP